MSSLQNPNPKQNLNPYPISSNQYPYPKPSPASDSKALTFDEVSKLFSLPLSDAADSLGVCTSVLKKICHENGLVGWPYRKIRAGKSIEEIRREAAREKDKHVKDLSDASGQTSSTPANSAVPSYLASQVDDKSASSVQYLSKSSTMTQQQGSKNPPTGNTQKSYVQNLPKGTSANLDEFKYGFPSKALSTVSYRWWGNSDSSGTKVIQDKSGKETQENNQIHIKELESSAVSSVKAVENGQNTTENGNLDHPETGSLSALRRRAVKEGEKALKLGVHHRYNLNRLDPKQKAVLLQVFKSSLPSQWIDE